MLPGLIYNPCQLELAGIWMLENVNKLQHFEVRLHFLTSKWIANLKGRSKLSTFMEAYRGYARGGGWRPPHAFFSKISILC